MIGMTVNYAEKIAGLLRKAERTDNPHEAKAFSEKAEHLMVKWGIDEAVARAAMGEEVPREQIIEVRVACKGTYHQGEFRIGEQIAYGLGNLRVLQSKRYMQSTIYVIGHESDVRRWEVLFASLRMQAHSAAVQWAKAERKAGRWSDEWWARQMGYYGGAGFKATTDTFPTVGMIHHEKFKARRQFLISFGYEVKERLAAMRREAIKTTTGAELALLDRSTLVDDWVGEHYPKLGKARGGLQRNWLGAQAGRAAGRNASLGENNLPGSRKGIGR